MVHLQLLIASDSSTVYEHTRWLLTITTWSKIEMIIQVLAPIKPTTLSDCELACTTSNSYIYYTKKQSDLIRIGMQVTTLLENDHYTLNVGNCVPKYLHTVFWDNESDNYIY